MTVYLVKLDSPQFHAYNDGTMSNVEKSSIDAFIDRMKLMGHYVYVTPQFEVEELDITDKDTLRPPEERPYVIFHVDVGTMPPVRAKAHIEMFKTNMKGHPLMHNALIFAKNADGRGSAVQVVRL